MSLYVLFFRPASSPGSSHSLTLTWSSCSLASSSAAFSLLFFLLVCVFVPVAVRFVYCLFIIAVHPLPFTHTVCFIHQHPRPSSLSCSLFSILYLSLSVSSFSCFCVHFLPLPIFSWFTSSHLSHLPLFTCSLPSITFSCFLFTVSSVQPLIPVPSLQHIVLSRHSGWWRLYR